MNTSADDLEVRARIESMTNGVLVFDYLNIRTIPSLPPGVVQLSCLETPHLESLPPLPKTLKVLICKNTNLSTLPNLVRTSDDPETAEIPDALQYIECSSSPLTSLPDLPATVEYILCNDTNIESLPTLPPRLLVLNCNSTRIDSLPELPPSLQELSCNHTNIESLPTLPVSLRELYCSYTTIRMLPDLPPSLTSLYCNNTAISTLPSLPNSLLHLNCSHTTIDELPVLPSSLSILNCESTPITSLPSPLPSSLHTIYASNTRIRTIPELPTSISFVIMDTTPLEEPFRTWYAVYSRNILRNLYTFIQNVNNYYHSAKVRGRNLRTLRYTLNQPTSKLPRNTVSVIGQFLSGKTGNLKKQTNELYEEYKETTRGGRRRVRKTRKLKRKL